MTRAANVYMPYYTAQLNAAFHSPTPATSNNSGMSKHRLCPYSACYLKWLTIKLYSSRFYFRREMLHKVLIILQLTQPADKEFQLSITLLQKAYFLRRLSRPSWLVTYLDCNCRPLSTNRAWCWLTSLIRPTPLTTTPRRQHGFTWPLR